MEARRLTEAEMDELLVAMAADRGLRGLPEVRLLIAEVKELRLRLAIRVGMGRDGFDPNADFEAGE